eukprot:gene28557-37723_t
MGCCYCCETEEQKANMVLSKFPIVTMDKLKYSLKPQLTTGRVVPAVNKVISPVSGREVIFYRVVVEEEEHNVDAEGNTSTYWVTRFEESVQLDFFLCDPSKGNQFLYIPASIAPVKEFGIYSGSSGPTIQSFFTGSYTPSIDALLSRHGFRAVRGLRFTEHSIGLYDQVVLLSIVKTSDATGVLTYYSEPIPDNCVNDDYFKENNWSDWEIRSWHDLFKYSSMIVTNNPNTFQGQAVPPISSPPPYLPVLTTPMVFSGYPQYSGINVQSNIGYIPVNGGVYAAVSAQTQLYPGQAYNQPYPGQPQAYSAQQYPGQPQVYIQQPYVVQPQGYPGQPQPYPGQVYAVEPVIGQPGQPLNGQYYPVPAKE